MGLIYLQLNYFVEAKEAIDPIVSLAIEKNYNKKLVLIYTIIGAYNHFIEENFPDALRIFRDALKLSELESDFKSLASMSITVCY